MFSMHWHPSKSKDVAIDGTRAISCMIGIFLLINGCSRSEPHRAQGATVLDPNVFTQQLRMAMDLGHLSKLTREDFGDPERSDLLLRTLVSAYYKAGPLLIGNSWSLRLMGDPADRIRGTEMSEAAYRELFKDPVFVFDGNNWSVEFNAFGPNGGMDRWTVAGHLDPETGTVHISEAKFEHAIEDVSWVWRESWGG